MPIQPPRLDDRSFEDLVETLLARIPSHAPEYTNPRPGDPGRTLIELFAWLHDTVLYRANLIPERQRLAFLRLLGRGMRPAIPARGLVTISLGDETASRAVSLAPRAKLPGPVGFETRAELTVQPVRGELYAKRPLLEGEGDDLADVVVGLRELYGFEGDATPYVTTPVFPDGQPRSEGFDVIEGTVDQCLWLALLAPEDVSAETVRSELGGVRSGRQALLSVGVAPRVARETSLDESPTPVRIPYLFEICTGREVGGEPEYLSLDRTTDTSEGLSRDGVVRLVMPAAQNIGAPSDDVRENLRAGLGDRPPRLDDPERAGRLVTWIRLRSVERLEHLHLTWLGINAAEIAQLETSNGVVLGVTDGSPGQVLSVSSGGAGGSVEADSFALQVEEPETGYRPWQRGELFRAGRDDRVFELDAEAGEIQFGDGMNGRIPEAGMRVRVAQMRAGGGRVGNLPAGSLAEVKARDLQGQVVHDALVVAQPRALTGGADAESLDQAQRRIPAELRHGDRAVTEDDFRELASRVPGLDVGRVEVLPRFMPQQRREEVPGVVSVMMLPAQGLRRAPNPRPDRPFLEAAHAYLDERRPLATELYVIGCEYVALGLSVGVTARRGFGPDQVAEDVREALRRHLWSLSPGGVERRGWPLGRAVVDLELRVIVAQVPGVRSVLGLRLFEQTARAESTPDAAPAAWLPIEPSGEHNSAELVLEPWQLPELGPVVVVTGGAPPDDLRSAPDPFGSGGGVAVPVVPEVC